MTKRFVVKFKEHSELEKECEINSNARGGDISFNEAKKSPKAQEVLKKLEAKREEKLKNKRLNKIISEGDHFDVVELDEDELEALKNDPQVEYVSEDVYVEPAIQTADWSVPYAGVDSLTKLTGKTGEGVTVMVLDSGINYNHEDFNKSKLTGLRFDSTTGRLLGNKLEDALDKTGHGTNVAGVIAMQNNDKGYAGVAPDVNLISVRITSDTSGGALTSVMASAINYVLDNNIKVDFVNISYALYSSDIPEFKEAYARARSKDVVFVFSAGNDGNEYGDGDWGVGNDKMDRVGRWRDLEGAILVGAVEEKNGITYRKDYSSYGAGITLSAPSGLYVPAFNSNNGYKKVEGTSFSAPFVVGALALLKSILPTNSNKNIASILETAFLSKSGSKNHFGKGVLSLDSNVKNRETITNLSKSYYKYPESKEYTEITTFGNKNFEHELNVTFSGYPRVRMKIYASGDWNNPDNTLTIYPLGAIHPYSVTRNPDNYYNPQMSSTLKDFPEDSLLIADFYAKSGQMFDFKLIIESKLGTNGKGRLFFVTEDASHLQF